MSSSPWRPSTSGLGGCLLAALLLGTGGCTGSRSQPDRSLTLRTHLDQAAFAAEVREDGDSTSAWGGIPATIAIISLDAVMLPAQVISPGGPRDWDHVLAMGVPLSTHVMLVVSRDGQEVRRIPVKWGDHCCHEAVPAGTCDLRLELVSPCLRRMVELPPVQDRQPEVAVDVVSALRTQPEAVLGR